MADKDPIALLGERSQRRGNGNYREAYTVVPERLGEQTWRVTIYDKETGRFGESAQFPSKKVATKDAAIRLLSILGEAASAGGGREEVGASLNDDALIGDKVLGLCLVLWLREQGIVDKGVVTQRLARLLSNESLQKNGHKIGVEVSGWQTHRDGSLVEQHVWKVFVEEKMDIIRTVDRVKTLFE